VEIVNSYAIPFEEDPSQSSIWFLDHLFHESMFAMMRKVSDPLCRSAKKKNLSDGTPLETPSKPTIFRSMRSSGNTQIDPSSSSSTSNTAYHFFD
jgi:hypothetical protein